jgi:hypothetical protein
MKLELKGEIFLLQIMLMIINDYKVVKYIKISFYVPYDKFHAIQDIIKRL